MTIRVAINGYGRIGRCVLRALFERQHPARTSDSSVPLSSQFQIVAINELADAQTIAHLTKYDSTHGLFPAEVSVDGQNLLVDGQSILLLHESDPAKLPWQSLNIDLLLECSGSYSDRHTAERHINAGAKHLLFSHPATAEIDATVVFGFNHQALTGAETIISSGSCSTNCVIPVIETIHKAFGIETGITWTVHSAMHDQPVIDAYHDTDLRKTRSAFNSIIPVDTGLHLGIERLMPEFEGRFQSLAMRVPTVNVSAIDFALNLSSAVTVEQVNDSLKSASVNHYGSIMGYTEEPVASCDFNHDCRSVIVDASQTRVVGNRHLALHTWFDNEWGYANRMIDVAAYWSSLW
ncbi:type I glyceraldehyde-3-phosphate dehydrogenase [Sessilibacter sp. MAH4]